jgi:hypothetical protein
LIEQTGADFDSTDGKEIALPHPLTHRPSVLLRFIGSRSAAAALLLTVASLGVSGCPGELDPDLLNARGTGGTGGTQVCNGAAFMKGAACSRAGCHFMTDPASGFDLYSDGVIQRLLGRPPDPATSLSCAQNTTPLLVSGSNPATGLLLDKLKKPAPCGTAMPYPGLEPLPAADIACIQEWATAVTTGAITQ